MLCLLQVMVRIRGKPFQCGKKEVVVVIVVVWLSISSINSTPPPPNSFKNSHTEGTELVAHLSLWPTLGLLGIRTQREPPRLLELTVVL